MAQIQETDRYDDSGDSFKVCSYCKDPVAKSSNSITVGMCERHLAIFQEDIEIGLGKQNRLKDLILKSTRPLKPQKTEEDHA